MSIFNNITNFFNNKDENKILGVDIGSSSIKIVQLSRKNGVAILDTFGEISLSVYAGKKIGQPVVLSTEKLAEALSDLMTESQVSAKSIAFAVPLKSTLMFNLKIPKTIEQSKLSEIVKLESRKYIPVPITEVQMDWSVLPQLNYSDQQKKKEDVYNILVVAIHKETLSKYGKIASTLGLNIKFLEVETFSLIRSMVKYKRDNLAILDIGAAVTKLYVVELGVFKKSYIINIGSSKMIEYFNTNRIAIVSNNKKSQTGEIASLIREEKQKQSATTTPTDLIRLVNEVRKNLLNYQKSNNKNIPAIVLTGGGVLTDRIENYFKKELSMEVTVGDPFSRVDNPAFLDDALKDAGATFAVSVGIALRGLK